MRSIRGSARGWAALKRKRGQQRKCAQQRQRQQEHWRQRQAKSFGKLKELESISARAYRMGVGIDVTTFQGHACIYPHVMFDILTTKRRVLDWWPSNNTYITPTKKGKVATLAQALELALEELESTPAARPDKN